MKHIHAFGLAIGLVILTATSLCFAADYDYKTMTPEIKQALRNRHARYHELRTFKQDGAIGENNKGYVTNLKDSPAAASLTTAENQDRRVLYETLAEQNKLGSTGLLEIQRAFAEVRKEKAHAGDMVQSASGDWKKKS